MTSRAKRGEKGGESDRFSENETRRLTLGLQLRILFFYDYSSDYCLDLSMNNLVSKSQEIMKNVHQSPNCL